MLPHKHDRYSLRQFSKDTVFRVGMVPYACIGEGSLIWLSEPIQYEYEGEHTLPIAWDIKLKVG